LIKIVFLGVVENIKSRLIKKMVNESSTHSELSTKNIIGVSAKYMEIKYNHLKMRKINIKLVIWDINC